MALECLVPVGQGFSLAAVVRGVSLAAAALALSFAIACGAAKKNDVAPPPPPPPSIPAVPTSFSGTLNPGGSSLNTFTFDAGTIVARVTSLSGVSSIGVSLGSYANNVCTPYISNSGLAANSSITTPLSPSGTGCVRIYDAAGAAGTITYAVAVERSGS